ncbi:hypothetical protein KEM52_005610, partial [Ascosphaera acerosa]
MAWSSTKKGSTPVPQGPTPEPQGPKPATLAAPAHGHTTSKHAAAAISSATARQPTTATLVSPDKARANLKAALAQYHSFLASIDAGPRQWEQFSSLQNAVISSFVSLAAPSAPAAAPQPAPASYSAAAAATPSAAPATQPVLLKHLREVRLHFTNPVSF